MCLTKTVGFSPIRAVSRVEEERRRKAEVGMALTTIHPNPGPQLEGRRKARRERRKKRRERRRQEKARKKEEDRLRGLKTKEELVVVTWNVQSMSVESLRRMKMRQKEEIREGCIRV